MKTKYIFKSLIFFTATNIEWLSIYYVFETKIKYELKVEEITCDSMNSTRSDMFACETCDLST